MVTTTFQEIIDAAWATSIKNQPNTLAVAETELFNLVDRVLRKYYAAAARVNPIHFAEQATVAHAPGPPAGWARPDGSENVFRIEEADGTHVRVVPQDDKLAVGSIVPAVYELGRFFRVADTVPSGTPALEFYYTKRPLKPADVTGLLDPLWEEEFNELLVQEVALYLATKDNRTEEMQMFTKSRDEWASLYAAFLQHSTSDLHRRFGHTQQINTHTQVPVTGVAQ